MLMVDFPGVSFPALVGAHDHQEPAQEERLTGSTQNWIKSKTGSTQNWIKPKLDLVKTGSSQNWIQPKLDPVKTGSSQKRLKTRIQWKRKQPCDYWQNPLIVIRVWMVSCQVQSRIHSSSQWSFQKLYRRLQLHLSWKLTFAGKSQLWASSTFVITLP